MGAKIVFRKIAGRIVPIKVDSSTMKKLVGKAGAVTVPVPRVEAVVSSIDTKSTFYKAASTLRDIANKLMAGSGFSFTTKLKRDVDRLAPGALPKKINPLDKVKISKNLAAEADFLSLKIPKMPQFLEVNYYTSKGKVLGVSGPTPILSYNRKRLDRFQSGYKLKKASTKNAKSISFQLRKGFGIKDTKQSIWEKLRGHIKGQNYGPRMYGVKK